MSIPPPQYPGQPKKSSPWPWIVGLGCGIPIVGMIGCVAMVGTMVKKVADDPEFKKSMQKMSETSTNKALEKLVYKVGSQKTGRDATGLLHVKGTITNTSAEPVPYVQVTIEGLDKKYQRVADGIASTTHLGPGNTWVFDVTMTSKDTATIGDTRISTTPLGE